MDTTSRADSCSRRSSDHHPSEVLLFPANTTDPAQAARTVLDRSPGYVFLAGKTAEFGPIADALRLAGYTGDFGAADGFYNSDTITTYGRSLQGTLVASPMPPLDRIPSAVSLVTRFRTRGFADHDALSAYGYAAAQLMIAAVAARQRDLASTTPDVAAVGRHVHDAGRPVCTSISAAIR